VGVPPDPAAHRIEPLWRALWGCLAACGGSNAGSAVARGESKSVAGCWGAGWNSRMVAVRRFVLGTSQGGQACDMSGGQRFKRSKG
jgi:hypothetical protein